MNPAVFDINWIRSLQCLQQIIMGAMKRQSKIPLSSIISKEWSKHQLDNLQAIVLSIRPNSISDWRRVCLKMHEIGSRKTYWQYKVPGDIILAKNQRIQIKLSREQIRNIFRRFGEGCSMQELTQKYGNILTNLRRVRQMITKQCKSISLVMKWTIGRRNLRMIVIRDYHLFKFIRSRNLDFPNFNQVADHCERYKVILKSKEEEHRKERHRISIYLNRFNTLLKAYAKIYEDAIRNRNHRPENPSHPRVIDTPTIPYQHLARMLEQNLQKCEEESFQFNKYDFQEKQGFLEKRVTMVDSCFQMWCEEEFQLFSAEQMQNCFEGV